MRDNIYPHFMLAHRFQFNCSAEQRIDQLLFISDRNGRVHFLNKFWSAKSIELGIA